MRLNCGCHAEYDSVFSAHVTDWHECPLHAAAPDLLAACNELVENLARDSEHLCSPHVDYALALGRAAIAKAVAER